MKKVLVERQVLTANALVPVRLVIDGDKLGLAIHLVAGV